MSRPLFHKSLSELQLLFEECKDSPDQLKQLMAELAYRKTPKAVELRKRVDALLNGNGSPPAKPSRPPKQGGLLPTPGDDGPKPPKSSSPIGSSGESSSDQSYLDPPNEFTIVQPMGVKPRPSAFRPTLKEDLQLDVALGAPPITVFRVALSELIREMRRRRVGYQQFQLEDGQRVPTEVSGNSYQFEFGEEASLFEGAKVEILVGGRVVDGQLTALMQGRIIVTLQEDFGNHITSCVLRVDNTALFQALHDRLQTIERGEADGFRADLAECVLSNSGSQTPGKPLTGWPWSQPPTARQKQFVEMALANTVSWLWGPPGTGKTDVLSAVARILYESEKRVLICSNTNRAVDQLLQKLCRFMQEVNDPALTDGYVLRLGRIEEELDRQFGEYITPDRVVERKSEGLTRRKADIEAELERLGREVAYSQDVLQRFEELASARVAARTAADSVTRAERDLDQGQSAVTAAQRRRSQYERELQRWQQAGFLGRLLMRDEASIRHDIRNQETRIEAATEAIVPLRAKLEAVRAESEAATDRATAIERSLAYESREEHQKTVANYDSKQTPLRQELSTIAAKLEDIRNSVLREARIVGATVTRTFLRPVEFAAFDTVIVDEASMILLPAVFHATGLARERVIIAGDFQQLPPIVQTEQKSIHDVLAHDVFENAGITHETVKNAPRLVMLDEQFRMEESICDIVSGAFYGGRLRTSALRRSESFAEPSPLEGRLTVIDTSRVWPFTTRNVFESRLNLMHALAIRNLVLHLREQNRLFDRSERCRVGVCTPYAAQAKLLHDMFKAHSFDPGTLRAGTVHRFQGDERPIMVFDLVDSVGERNAGIFLQANQLRDGGAKLMNVALSRAQEGLIVVGNLTFLDRKLPSDAILRGLLCDLQRRGQILDVRDVLALYPILEDLKHFGSQPELDPEALRTGLFKGRDFARICRHDMEKAEKSIIVFSAFITPERAAQMGDLFRARIQEGVKVRCVTRPPQRNGTMPEELGRSALAALEALGVAIDLRFDIHEKVVLIDNRIVWFGSLNPLSHTARTSEIMARVDDRGVAAHLASVLSIRRRSSDDTDPATFAEAENPRCEICSGWSMLCHSKYGYYFRCACGCDWKQNIDGPRRKAR